MNIYRICNKAVLLSLAMASALSAQKLIPGGSLVSCRVSEKISPKVTDVGDPIVCDISHSQLPWGSIIVGTFQEYKDAGHFVGKGWMELVFERIILPQGRVVQVSAKVVEGPGYHVDKEGHILGKGHNVRDTVSWFFPILWPLDIINLPRRGPVPVIKAETKLKLKLMEDVVLPIDPEVTYWEPPVEKHERRQRPEEPQQDENGFRQRPAAVENFDQQGGGSASVIIAPQLSWRQRAAESFRQSERDYRAGRVSPMYAAAHPDYVQSHEARPSGGERFGRSFAKSGEGKR